MPLTKFKIDPASYQGKSIIHALETGKRQWAAGDGLDDVIIKSVIAYNMEMLSAIEPIQDRWQRLARRNAYLLVASLSLNIGLLVWILA